MLVAVENWFNIGHRQHQHYFLKQTFKLLRSVSKTFQKRVRISEEEYNFLVASNYINALLINEIRHIYHHIDELKRS